jgi:DNA-binding transcriptional MerR regulator
MTQLTIGKLAEETGVTADTLRYYEKMKLLKAQERSKAGYRLYDRETINVIRFIRGAKALNFTLEEIRSLLRLKTSDTATCSEMVTKTEEKIAEAERKIIELKEIKKVLTHLVKKCPGGDAPIEACPILEHLNKTADCCHPSNH